MCFSKVRDIFLFVFSPTRFNRRAVQHHERYVKKTKGASAEFDRQDSERNNREQVRLLRSSFFRSLWYVFWALALAIFSGFVLARVFDAPLQWALAVLQLFGAFMLLGATLWQIGEAASASEQWLAEKVHNWLFKSFYIIGTYLLGCALSWDGFYKLYAH